jgi:hypothetical protein
MSKDDNEGPVVFPPPKGITGDSFLDGFLWGRAIRQSGGVVRCTVSSRPSALIEEIVGRAEEVGLAIDFEENKHSLILVLTDPEGTRFLRLPNGLRDRAIRPDIDDEFLSGFFCARLSKSPIFAVSWNSSSPDLLETLDALGANYIIDEYGNTSTVRLRMNGLPDVMKRFLDFIKAEDAFMAEQTGLIKEASTVNHGSEHGGGAGAEVVEIPDDLVGPPSQCPPYGTIGHIARSLRRDSRHSVVATGKLPKLNQAIYIHDAIDDQIAAWMKSPVGGLLVLTGSAGHGKSAAVSLAREQAEANGLELHVRPDASHADHPSETYRDGLRRFLDNWMANPAAFHVVAINLGKALDFYSHPEDIERYPTLAAALDEKYALGLGVQDLDTSGIRIIDLSQRIQPVAVEGRLDIPLVRGILEKFNPISKDSIIENAWTYQIQHGLGDRDPILANLRLLQNENFKDNLLEALASSIVRHDLHLTPRSVLDLISRLLVPESVERNLDDMGMWSEDQRRTYAEPKSWGARLHASLLAELFPSSPKDAFADQALQRLMRFEDPVVRALRHENPAYTRSRDMDNRLIAWSHDPEALAMDIPDWFLAYLEWRPTVGRWAEGPRALMQVARWTDAEGPRSTRIMEVIRFLRLVHGNTEDEDAQRVILKRALQQCVTKTYFRAMSDRNLGQLMAIKVHRTPTKVSVLTSLSRFDVRISAGPEGKRAFSLVIERAGQENMVLPVDWATFDLLSQVHNGVNPGAISRSTNHVIDRLVRTLQGTSEMKDHLECELPEMGGYLTLSRDKTSKDTRIGAGFRND